MSVWRPSLDGALVAPRRGRPPACPDGYQVDSGDAFVCYPVLPDCVNRSIESRDTRCCKGKTIMMCKSLNKMTTRLRCLQCGGKRA